MRRALICGLFAAAALATAARAAAAAGAGQGQRVVLVELFTSQGCDMCPEAERILGELGDTDARVVPLALHIDYFNKPWKDPFSDRLHSERQAAYNANFAGPKHPDYGLYYTPMVMVDGTATVNGRDAPGLRAAVRSARSKPPRVDLATTLKLDDGGKSGELALEITPRSPRVEGRELLVCAVLRDDRVSTAVLSGENANKTLNARYPARVMKYEFVRAGGSTPSKLRFAFKPDPSIDTARLGLVVFAQDRKTGEVYQSAYVPWRPPTKAP